MSASRTRGQTCVLPSTPVRDPGAGFSGFSLDSLSLRADSGYVVVAGKVH